MPCTEDTCLLSMCHGNGETGLEKLKESLKDLDFTSKLIKVSIYSPSINWKPWDL